MSSISPKRAQMMEALDMAGRQSGAVSVMFHQAIAERQGLNATDHKCLDFLLRHGAVTAGGLAELTGLTTGAITGIVDRLEKAGVARRERDPGDRRRVIIRVVMTPERAEEYAQLFTPFLEALHAIYADYSDTELALILDFMEKINTVVHMQTLKIRDEDAGSSRNDPG